MNTDTNYIGDIGGTEIKRIADGVCGGNVAVAPGETVFSYPSFIECTGTDGTIDYIDEYDNEVSSYPMVKGKTTNFRVKSVTAATATGLYRCYAK